MTAPLIDATPVGFLDSIVSCLRYEISLEETLPPLAEALRAYMPINALAVSAPGKGGQPGATLVWSGSPLLSEDVLRPALNEVRGLFDSCPPRDGLGAAAKILSDLLPPDYRRGCNGLMLPLGQGQHKHDFLFLNKAPDKGPWNNEEICLAQISAVLVAVFTAGQAYCADQIFHNRIFNVVMDRIKVGIYITDPETDKVLYMNNFMKEIFNLQNPEGKICWQILQRAKTQRCEFCPVATLKKEGDSHSVYRWEEHNTLTGRFFENYDSLMPWTDGTLMHLQQTIDITDSRRLRREAYTDGLTGLMNRRAGLKRLARSLFEARESDTALTVSLLDVNDLKRINDTFGHTSGDRALWLVAREVENALADRDFCFRLSGDEFVVVFHNAPRYAASKTLEDVLLRLNERQESLKLPFAPDFCFGCFEVRPELKLSLTAILSKADESMYEQKKRLHIKMSAERLRDKSGSAADDGLSDCDPALLYDALCRSTDAYVYVSMMSTGVFRYSPAMVRDFDLPGEIVPNAAAIWGAHVHPDDKAAFLESNQIIADGRSDSHCVEYRAKNREGQWVWLRCRGYLERDANGEPALFAGFIVNLGQKNKIDHITGLLNKIKFEEDLTAALQMRPSTPLHLMVLGADNFKHINELHGRLFGDEVLRLMAQKLQAMLPQNASLYRLDGDVFAILLQGEMGDPHDFYASLAESFRYQQEYEKKKYFCPLSGGYALYPDDADNYEDLFQAAACALTAAKKNGRNRIVIFNRSLHSAQKRALELTELLRESIDRQYEGFELHYQPQVTADGMRLVGAEALARWCTKKYGVVSPAEFIPLLEQSGMIVPFGQWVFKEAMRQCKQWTNIQPDFVVSVNLSYLQIISENMLPLIKSTLEKHDLNPRNVVLEFTESCMIRENASLHNIFNDIRALGIRIAMDDFGTGYSSLNMLKTSPADTVKIDRAFVRDILNSSFDATFIRFVVTLCHDVGIKVCLEGVEREAELRLVQSMQLDYIQGFFFGRPTSAVDFERKFLT